MPSCGLIRMYHAHPPRTRNHMGREILRQDEYRNQLVLRHPWVFEEILLSLPQQFVLTRHAECIHAQNYRLTASTSQKKTGHCLRQVMSHYDTGITVIRRLRRAMCVAADYWTGRIMQDYVKVREAIIGWSKFKVRHESDWTMNVTSCSAQQT